MTWPWTMRGIMRLPVLIGALSACCLAQTASPAKQAAAPCATERPSATAPSTASSSQPKEKPCAPAKPKSVAEQFPFPGEAAPPETPAANSPTPGAPHPSAASEHPFPGEPATAADSSSSSSSSDDGYDPDAPLPSTMRHPPKPPRVQTPDERVDEDLRVSKFYLDDGNLPGAYLRAKDAVRVEPDYSETHYTLAQVLHKMKKTGEAIEAYKTYLKMDPDGDHAKAARRALAQLKK